MQNLDFINKVTIWATPRLHNAIPSWAFQSPNLRFRAYCVGAPKTGTTTMAMMFRHQYRSSHEPEASLLLEKMLNVIEGKSHRQTLISYLKHRDKRLGLEMDSSHLNYPLLDIFLNQYQDAKFILTIRDCYSWLDSLLNHHFPIYDSLGHRKEFQNRKWIRFYKHLFRAEEFQHTKEEIILSDHHLFTLSGYFSYWAEHNQKVISMIPKEKLLIVRTKELDQDIHRIENFLGLTEGNLTRRIYGNKRNSIEKLNILSKIDRHYLEDKADQYCQDLMRQYFPEISTVQDAGIKGN
jgi:Sulfotransferase domain